MPDKKEPKRREPLENPCELCGRRESLRRGYCSGGLCGSCERRYEEDEDVSRDLNGMRGWQHPSRPYR